MEITGQRVVFQTADLPSPEPIADTTAHEVTSPIVQLDNAITKYPIVPALIRLISCYERPVQSAELSDRLDSDNFEFKAL